MPSICQVLDKHWRQQSASAYTNVMTVAMSSAGPHSCSKPSRRLVSNAPLPWLQGLAWLQGVEGVNGS